MGKDSFVVCGTGIAGLAAALGLARDGHAVQVLGPRKAPAPTVRDQYCPRVYAISPSSRALLSRLGVWDIMDAERITSVRAMEIHGDAAGSVNLDAWQAAQDSLAWIVESSEMERALHQAVRVYGIPWVEEKFDHLDNGAVHTQSGRVLQPDLLIGADGAESPVRRAAGIAHHSRAYGDMGIVVHLAADLPHQNTAFQWFTGDSVLALLPMPDTAEGHQVSMVWSMPEALAQTWMTMPEDERARTLEARLAAASEGRLGGLRMRSTPFAFPLYVEHSDMVAPGVALVGDAGHRVHPLAGQGLNLGLGDVAALLRVQRDREPFRAAGDMRLLRRYRRARAEPILAMRMATDGLHRLFAVQGAPIAWARNAGMQWADRLPFVKRLLIDAATGNRHGA
ncbi:ubiquinone biosynthesis protein UbiH [Allopusillimonas soli]|uniref:FAD-dependent monooxygenase n=1 Tax=Allopusillimonas soli TaxID=659016 RepID=A0A853FJJ3_9BURK|nr:FAD-dependent monooxygenase [Allopusillimonas soli]NYT38106.1 FAD-dependent monooxygenase [Allopusillimonas soli]TEA73983.1 ubiquinone biosynthesis protein UbiH [Allopusillimonas soli]